MVQDELDQKQWDDLVDRLAAHDIRYFTGGRGHLAPPEVGLLPLALDLLRAPQARLHDALVALFLRHPAAASELAGELDLDEPVQRRVAISIVVAAALQSEWGFSLDIYLPGQPRIEAAALARYLSLPRPVLDYGRPCLRAAQRALLQGARFPFNYRAGWEDAVHRLLSQLIRDANLVGA
ncbi:MAG: hypothetical protein ACRDFS_04255 [Chloroflexota bacterium]